MNAFPPPTLGTAQLGMAYGIANASGKPDRGEAQEILTAAIECGFEFIDTAPIYGTSEQTLGELLDPTARAQVVSKITLGVRLPQWREELAASLARLRRRSLHTWLLHNELDFPQINEEALSLVDALKAEGLIKDFGVSCYTLEVGLAAMKIPQVTALQVPANVFDRRFLSSEFPVRDGVFIFVRSVFLQGLCLMEAEQVPHLLPGAVEGVRLFRQHCRKLAISPQAFCLHYVNHRLRGQRHSLVLGVETAAQVRDLAHLMSTPSPAEEAFEEWDAMWPESPPEMINPGLWPQYRQP